MTNEATIPVSSFRSAVKMLLDEIFDHHHGIVTDNGDQLLTTLAGITAEEASEPVSSQTASLGAEVNHLCVYIEAILKGREGGPVDWAGSWTDVSAVTDAEWAELIERVKRDVAQIRAFVDSFEDWNEEYIAGAIALIAHTAYHLGEIRTGIGVIRDRRTRA